MNWKPVDKDFVAKTDKFVFRLKNIGIGFYGAGKAYSLKARKVDEVKEESLGFCFWFRDDNSDRWKDKSVEGKLWNKTGAPHIAIHPDTSAIIKKADDILAKLGYE